MIIDNVKVYTPDQKFVEGGLVLDQDRIEAVYTNETKPDLSGKEVLDGEGAYAIPGLIDLHFHGCKGDDFCDNSMEAIERIAEYEASVGVTAIAPATMTLPVEELVDVLKTAAQYKREKHDYKKADLVRHQHGRPLYQPCKKGAQDDRNILPCVSKELGELAANDSMYPLYIFRFCWHAGFSDCPDRLIGYPYLSRILLIHAVETDFSWVLKISALMPYCFFLCCFSNAEKSLKTMFQGSLHLSGFLLRLSLPNT